MELNQKGGEMRVNQIQTKNNRLIAIQEKSLEKLEKTRLRDLDDYNEAIANVD